MFTNLEKDVNYLNFWDKKKQMTHDYHLQDELLMQMTLTYLHFCVKIDVYVNC